MIALLCILFGHRWELLAFTPDQICLRCHSLTQAGGGYTPRHRS